MRLDEVSATGTTACDRQWRLRRLAPVAALVLVMALVFAMGWHRFVSLDTLVRHRAAIDAFIAARFGLAIAAFVGVYVAVVALSIPGAAVLTVAGGVLFGWFVGGLAAIVGATVGATLVFLIARSACAEFILRRAGPLVAKAAQGFCADAFNYLLFLRLVPVFPFWLVNLAPALVGVGLGTFVLATALGIIPGTFAYSLVGAGLDSVIAAQEAAYRACLAAGHADCRLDFSLSAVATPQLLAGFAALGVVALIPVAVRKWRARVGAGMAG
ncbi:MAG TPA: TVP38/TMEM64 family protein [Xanthobacteraceae bacterium]|nr:TVP38/TMEM64 family protein [Xanthobacteraceae bacterium]